MKHPASRPSCLFWCATAALSLLMAGCASDQGADTASGTSSASSGASGNVLGEPKAASGEPIKVGIVSDGKGPTIDYSPEIPSQDAAVKYINEYLGGIDGRPIEIDRCITLHTPAGATDCANQMVRDGVVAVIQNIGNNTGLTYKGLGDIPYFVYSSGDPSVIKGETSHIVTNVLGTQLATAPALAKDMKLKRVTVVAWDSPGTVAPVKNLLPTIYGNAGVELDTAIIPAGTADMTPQIQTALETDPDMFAIIGDPTFCTSALKAIRGSSFDGVIQTVSSCIDPASAASIPNGYEGIRMGTASSKNPDDEETQIYTAVMDKYAPDSEPYAGVTAGGFAVVMGFYRAMSDLTGDVTAESVQAAASTMSEQPVPLATGNTFQCNRQQVALAPSTCSAGGLVATLDKDGNPSGEYGVIDTLALLKPAA
jgi:branched-chain amino acid transport system substrate-binding protein